MQARDVGAQCTISSILGLSAHGVGDSLYEQVLSVFCVEYSRVTVIVLDLEHCWYLNSARWVYE